MKTELLVTSIVYENFVKQSLPDQYRRWGGLSRYWPAAYLGAVIITGGQNGDILLFGATQKHRDAFWEHGFSVL